MRNATRWLATGMAMALCGIAAADTGATRGTPEQRLAEITRGAAPGKPVSCISRFPTQRSETVYGLGLVYIDGRTVYVQRFENGCRLTQNDILVTRTPGTQLCRGDIATVLDNTSRFPRDTCVYGDFVPYVRPKAPVTQR